MPATHVTVSTFEPDPNTGELRRRKANFVAMNAVMIDDIGTKVSSKQLRLPPSALIETSPGNFQAYYFLEQGPGTRDRALCELLIERMVAAGLATDGKDPCMTGVTRFGRLPVGVNGKARYVEQLGRPFAVTCAVFEPRRRYGIAEIAKAWRLDLTPPRPPAPVRMLSSSLLAHTESTFAGLMRTLNLMGMYHERIGCGPWHAIRCPWVHEHNEHAETADLVAAEFQEAWDRLTQLVLRQD